MLMVSPLNSAFTQAVEGRLAQGQRVRRRLPAGNGRLHIDRRVPFLCVHRRATEEALTGAERFVTGQASYLQAEAEDTADPGLAELVQRIAMRLREGLGDFLLLEVWEEAAVEPEGTTAPHLLCPGFTLVVSPGEELEEVLEAFTEALEGVRLGKCQGRVRRDLREIVAPPGLEALLPPGAPAVTLGLAVEPVYRNRSGEVFPMVLLRLEEQLREVLERGLFAFSRHRTRLEAPHYRALGRRTHSGAAWNVDRRLEAVNDSFDFLLQVTPVDSDRAWEGFRASDFREPPQFHYRPLPLDPQQVKRALFDIPIERVEDPVLARLFREKQEELDRQVSLLGDRGTRRFLLGSLMLYGGVEPKLLRLAQQLLSRLPAHDRGEVANGHVDAETFARCARVEIARYHRQMPAFRASVQVRPDIAAAAMVSKNRLLVGQGRHIAKNRVEALLHHEVGTHLLTYFNGKAQRIRLFHCGLAGYETLQEGIAVLAEHLAGGLTCARLRTLAGRVIACHDLVEGASFVECFQSLTDDHGFPSRIAFFITTRVYRGGGLTKDAIYLRGLRQLIRHLRRGGDLERLLVGKIALRHLSAVEDLWYRDFFQPATVLPRYLEEPEARHRLEQVRSRNDVLDLIAERHEIEEGDS